MEGRRKGRPIRKKVAECAIIISQWNPYTVDTNLGPFQHESEFQIRETLICLNSISSFPDMDIAGSEDYSSCLVLQHKVWVGIQYRFFEALNPSTYGYSLIQGLWVLTHGLPRMSSRELTLWTADCSLVFEASLAMPSPYYSAPSWCCLAIHQFGLTTMTLINIIWTIKCCWVSRG